MSGSIHQIESLIHQGRYAEARSLAEIALKTSRDLRHQQLFALAVSKSGAPRAAMQFLEPVYREHDQDPETAGILGGIYKEIFRKDQNASFAVKSRDTYLKNFASTKSHYTGINAATMSMLAGQASRGKEIAREVIAMLNPDTQDFWERVTIAEARLLCQEREKAIAEYFFAKKIAGTDWGRINSVHSQLWLLNHYIPVPGEILKVFSPPGVVSFVGHMIDHPSRSSPRFPASIEARVKDAIAGAIRTLNVRIGYCSLACGGDILFAEAMAEAGGEVNIWLPFAMEDFVNASVRFAGEDWVKRFEALTTRFPVSFITREPYAGYDDLFSFQNRVVLGSSVIRSAMNHNRPSLLTVLSETDLKQKEGGTRETIKVWPYPDRHININPDTFIPSGTQLPAAPAEAAARKKEQDRPVLYMVCAGIQQQGGSEHPTWKNIYEKLELPIVKPAVVEVGDELLVAYTSIVGATDLTTSILKTIRSLQLLPRMTMSLFAYPLQLESSDGDRRLTAETRRRILSLHSQIPPGGVYAFARFSSVLALDVSHFALDYAGVIAPDGETSPVEIYRVQV